MAAAWASAVSPSQTWAGTTKRVGRWSLQSHKNISQNETCCAGTSGAILPRIGWRSRGCGGHGRRHAGRLEDAVEEPEDLTEAVEIQEVIGAWGRSASGGER